MTSKIEAQLIISAQDQTAEALSKVRQNISKAQEAVERFRAASAKFSEARSNFRAAQTAVEQVAMAMRNATTPTREMQAAYERAQRAVRSASAAFEAQKAVVLGAKEGLASYGISLNQITGAQERLRLAAQQADAAMVAQQTRLERWARVKNAGSNIAMFAGPAVLTAAKDAVKAGAERQHEVARMDVSGMSKDEIAQAEQISDELSKRYPALSKTTIMHTVRNARAIVGTYQEAAKIMDPLLKLRVAAMGAHPERAGELSEDFDKLLKGIEIKGATMDPTKFTSYMQGMAKAINVFGDTLRPTDYYEMFKYGRQATQALSEKFMLETAPTLGQELGGSSAGKAMSSFYQAIVGGRIKEQSVKEMEKLGLINESKVVRTKTGSIKGLLRGGVKGWQLAASDPYAWTNEVLLPALKAHHVTDPAEIQAAIGNIFQQATAAQMVSVFATQQARIEKDWGLVHGAQGLEAADVFMNKDPIIAMDAFTEQFKNLLAALSSPAMQRAAEIMGATARGIAAAAEAYAKFSKENPRAAEAIGVTGIGVAGFYGAKWTLGLLSNVFGGGTALRGSAAALMASAHALDAAAVRLGGAPAGGGPAAIPASKGPWWMSYASALPGVNTAVQLWDLQQQAADKARSLPTVPWSWSGYLNNLTGGLAGTPYDLSGAKPVAKVEGDANLNINIKSEISDNLISRIVTAIENRINVFGADVGTQGSTGKSMPEAVPPR